KLPAQIQSLCNAPVFIRTLADELVLKGFSEFQIDLVDGRQFIFTDYRSQGSGISYLCIAGEKLIGYILVILSGKTFSDTVFHQTGKRAQYIDRRIDCLSVKLTLQNDLQIGRASCRERV